MILIGNLDLGHPIDTPNNLATLTPKSCKVLDNLFFWLGQDFGVGSWGQTKANFKNSIMNILSILFLRKVLITKAVCGFISKGLLPIEVLIFY